MGDRTDARGGARPAPRGGRRVSLAARVAASVVFLPCLVVVTRAGGVYFAGLVGLVAGAGALEFVRLARVRGARPVGPIVVAGALGMVAAAFAGRPDVAGGITGGVVVAALVTGVARRRGSGLVDAGASVLGVVYAGWLPAHLVALRELPVDVVAPYALGAGAVFLAVAATWAADTGAFFVGSALGRRPLLPRVSRGKTWEGALGGLASGLLATWIASRTFAPFVAGPATWVLGLVLPAVGLLGDLCESQLKRDADVKDASSVIPGHGGVLDRFDSLLLGAPVLYYSLKWLIL